MNIKNALVLLDKDNNAWLQELTVGQGYPNNALFICDVPRKSSPQWIEGIPTKDLDHFLVLCGRIDHVIDFDNLEVSIQTRESISQIVAENSNTQDWIIKYVPIPSLEFHPTPGFIPIAIHTFGLNWTNEKAPIKTVGIKDDNRDTARKKAYSLLNPNIIQRVNHIDTVPNPEFVDDVGKKPTFKMAR